MNHSKNGFTLIELLVVIAVIGILASIIIASLSNARAKSADAAAKEALLTVRNQAELYYLNQTPNTYGANLTSCGSGLFTTDAIISAAIAQALAQATAGASTTCATNSIGDRFAVSVSSLKSAGTPWCVDNSGTSAAKTAQTSGVNQGTCQ